MNDGAHDDGDVAAACISADTLGSAAAAKECWGPHAADLHRAASECNDGGSGSGGARRSTPPAHDPRHHPQQKHHHLHEENLLHRRRHPAAHRPSSAPCTSVATTTADAAVEPHLLLSTSNVAGYSSSSLAVMRQQLQRLKNPFDGFFRDRIQTECVAAESYYRQSTERGLVAAHESVLRSVIVNEESLWFDKAIVALRRRIALQPWCTGGCNYCCTALAVWARHVGKHHKVMRAELEEVEATVRRSLESSIDSEWQGFYDRVTAAGCALQWVVAQQSSLEAEAMHVAAIISFHEAESRRNASNEWELKRQELSWMAAKQQALETSAMVECSERRVDALWTRSAAQRLATLMATESSQRHAIAERNAAGCAELRARMIEARVRVQQEVWLREQQATFAELQELRIYKKQVEAERAQAERDRIAAIHQEWALELSEIKRLKKQGPPKSNAPLPPCRRCGQVPAKDAYTHRIAECVERPVSCPKCTEILPASQLEEHKTTVCPSRIVSCEACKHYFRASYFFGASGGGSSTGSSSALSHEWLCQRDVITAAERIWKSVASRAEWPPSRGLQLFDDPPVASHAEQLPLWMKRQTRALRWCRVALPSAESGSSGSCSTSLSSSTWLALQFDDDSIGVAMVSIRSDGTVAVLDKGLTAEGRGTSDTVNVLRVPHIRVSSSSFPPSTAVESGTLTTTPVASATRIRNATEWACWSAKVAQHHYATHVASIADSEHWRDVDMRVCSSGGGIAPPAALQAMKCCVTLEWDDDISTARSTNASDDDKQSSSTTASMSTCVETTWRVGILSESNASKPSSSCWPSCTLCSKAASNDGLQGARDHDDGGDDGLHAVAEVLALRGTDAVHNANEWCLVHLYRAVQIASSDVAQYCKPQIERKKGGKTAR